MLNLAGASMEAVRRKKFLRRLTIGQGIVGLLFSGCVIFLGLCHPQWQAANLCEWSYLNGTPPPCCAESYCQRQFPFCPEGDFVDCVCWFEEPFPSTSIPPQTFFFTDHAGPISVELSSIARLRASTLVWNVTTYLLPGQTAPLITFGGQQLSINGTTEVAVAWSSKGGQLTVTYPAGPAAGFPVIMFVDIISERPNIWSWLLQYLPSLLLFVLAISQSSFLKMRTHYIFLFSVNLILVYISFWFVIVMPWPAQVPVWKDWIVLWVSLVPVLTAVTARSIARWRCSPPEPSLLLSPLVPTLAALLSLIACIWSPGAGMAASLFGMAAVCLEATFDAGLCFSHSRGYIAINEAI